VESWSRWWRMASCDSLSCECCLCRSVTRRSNSSRSLQQSHRCHTHRVHTLINYTHTEYINKHRQYCVSLHRKHVIPLSLSTSLNSFLTTFRPDPCVLLIQISLLDQPVLLATFPLGPFLCLHLFTWNSLPAHIRSIDTPST